MALNKTAYSLCLDSSNANIELSHHLMQGSTDTEFIITLLKDGVEQTVDAGAKITMIIKYGIASCGVAAKGSYVLAPDDADYNITIATGKINIPVTEMVTNASGTNQLILKIEDGSIAYTYSMLYVVDVNQAYTAQATPDNLPTYKELKEEMDLIKVQSDTNKSGVATNVTNIGTNSQNISKNTQEISDLKVKDQSHDGDIVKAKQDIIVNSNAIAATNQEVVADKSDIKDNKDDITQAKTDIQTNTQSIADKADVDLGNVGSFAIAKEGDMFYKKSSKLEVAPMNISDANKEITTPYSFKTAPNTLKLGENIEIHENGGFVETKTKTENNPYLLVDYENDPIAGSKKPIYYERGAKVLKHELYSQDDTVMVLNSVNLGLSQFEHQTQAFYLNLVDPVQNMYLKVSSFKGDIAFYPSETGWSATTLEEKTKFPGYNAASGTHKFGLEPFWSSLNGYQLTLTFKADGIIRVLGDGSKPYLSIDENPITRKNMALMEDVTGSAGDTPEEIKNKLEGLAPGSQLSYNHLDDPPTIPAEETGQTIKDKLIPLKFPYSALEGIPPTAISKFTELTDTPVDYIGNANRFVKVNSAHTGLEFADIPGGTGVTEFEQLTDTPSSFLGMKGKALVVNATENGIEFVDHQVLPDSIDGGHATSTYSSNIDGGGANN